MASNARFLKLVCLYGLCSIVLIDVCFFILKPHLLSRLYHTQQHHSVPGISDLSESKSSAFSRHVQNQKFQPQLTTTQSGYSYPAQKAKSQSYSRFIQQKIMTVCVTLWDSLFIALEEFEELSKELFHISYSWFIQDSSLQRTMSMSNIPGSKDSQLATTVGETQSQSEVILDTSEIHQGTYALSVRIQQNILSKNVRIHRPSNEENFINVTYVNLTSTISRKLQLTIDLIREANNTLRLAKEFLRLGNPSKAKRLLDHARLLNPYDADVMAAYGEVFERHRPPDYVKAEHYYGKALLADPTNEQAKASRRRTLPLVEQIDQARFNRIDQKVYQYYHIPETHPGLRRLKKEHYFRYVYHSNAIEGNTLSLAQTRAILETRIAVGGKSLLEQNEVLGLDAALKFLNSSLLRKPGPLRLDDLLEIHRRVLGYVDLQEAGRLRNTQVFIADFEPPPASLVPSLMADFLSWLNSEDTQDLHPVELAALAHWKLVYIHPFYDGNGRTARLLMNLILMRAGYPPAIVRVEERAVYYQLLREANEGDVRPFIRFIGHCTEATIDEFLLTANKQVANNFEDTLGDSSSLAHQPLADENCKPRIINL